MDKKLVWDIPTRLFHWLLVILLVAQWGTAELGNDFMELHFYLGYTTLGLIVFRILWGFLGTKYAKFNDFLKGPAALWRYIKTLNQPKAPRTIGHNPVGGVFVVTVLLLVLAQAISGLFADDDMFYSGPYASSVSSDIQNVMQWIHHNTFNILMGLSLIHVLAILWYKWKLKHNLTFSMIHGKKPVTANEAISSSKLLMALILLVVVAVAIYGVVELLSPAPVEDFYY